MGTVEVYVHIRGVKCLSHRLIGWSIHWKSVSVSTFSDLKIGSRKTRILWWMCETWRRSELMKNFCSWPQGPSDYDPTNLRNCV